MLFPDARGKEELVPTTRGLNTVVGLVAEGWEQRPASRSGGWVNMPTDLASGCHTAVRMHEVGLCVSLTDEPSGQRAMKTVGSESSWTDGSTRGALKRSRVVCAFRLAKWMIPDQVLHVSAAQFPWL